LSSTKSPGSLEILLAAVQFWVSARSLGIAGEPTIVPNELVVPPSPASSPLPDEPPSSVPDEDPPPSSDAPPLDPPDEEAPEEEAPEDEPAPPLPLPLDDEPPPEDEDEPAPDEVPIPDDEPLVAPLPPPASCDPPDPDPPLPLPLLLLEVDPLPDGSDVELHAAASTIPNVARKDDPTRCVFMCRKRTPRIVPGAMRGAPAR
jgi:hypothetical protein